MKENSNQKRKSSNNQKDKSSKGLVACKDVFADIMRVCLFQGKMEIPEEELEDAATETTYRGNDGLRDQRRDAAKFWKNAKVCLALLGVENQDYEDKDMPLRVIGHDGAGYRDQLYYVKDENGKRKRNTNPRYPVITLVLYFNTKRRWGMPKRLKEALNGMPKEVEELVSDYEIHVFDVAWMSDEQLNSLTSDFRVVAEYFVQMRKGNEYKPSDIEMVHVNETMEMMSALTGDGRFEEAVEEMEEGKEVPRKVCEWLDRMIDKGIEEEKNKWTVEHLEALMKNMHLTLQEACKALGTTEQEYHAAKKQLQ